MHEMHEVAIQKPETATLSGLSLLVPVYNEEEHLSSLHQKLAEVLQKTGRRYEILYVDDGSLDNTFQKASEISESDPLVKVIQLRRNFGQTTALQAGIQHARHDVIVILDGNHQNDPADIPFLLEKLELGFDLVHGWRKDRREETGIEKACLEWMNRVCSQFSSCPLHDPGCSLKAIRRDIARELDLSYVDQRLIPHLAHRRGARCVEVVLRYAPCSGRKNKSLARQFRMLLKDLASLCLWVPYSESPARFFGRISAAVAGLSVFCGLTSLMMKLFQQADLITNPLIWTSATLLLASLQLLGTGLLADLRAHIKSNSSRSSSSWIRRIVQKSSGSPEKSSVRAA